MSARKLEKGANVAKEVSSPVVEKAKGKTGPDPDATEAKRESERVKNKERREEKWLCIKLLNLLDELD